MSTIETGLDVRKLIESTEGSSDEDMPSTFGEISEEDLPENVHEQLQQKGWLPIRPTDLENRVASSGVEETKVEAYKKSQADLEKGVAEFYTYVRQKIASGNQPTTEDLQVYLKEHHANLSSLPQGIVGDIVNDAISYEKREDYVANLNATWGREAFSQILTQLKFSPETIKSFLQKRPATV